MQRSPLLRLLAAALVVLVLAPLAPALDLGASSDAALRVAEVVQDGAALDGSAATGAVPTGEPSAEATSTTSEPQGWWERSQASADRWMGRVNGKIAFVFFYDVWFFDNSVDPATGVVDKGIDVQFAVLWLVLGSIFFTVRMGFVNLRMFRHAIDVVRGRFTDPKEHREGEVSHFQALSAALSATVGLGNIAGVAIAVGMGGPGATFWMIIAGLIGMSAKFTECSLGQIYKQRRPDGSVMGGAMHYLSKGLAEMGLKPLGMFLAWFFAILCIGGSLAGGNSFQVNQSLNAVSAVKGLESFGTDYRWVYGLIMTIAVGVVIIGGIKRIAQVAEKVVPSMCGIYIAACLFILLKNFDHIPDAIGTIVASAFNPDAAFGGFVGVLVLGFKRAAFSNEAGVGSAAIAHSAAHTDHPVREGIVALLEPFIDTVVVCTMTALVIVITGAYIKPEMAEHAEFIAANADFIAQNQAFIAANQGAALTSNAMAHEISWFPYILALATSLFAFSTMISWSYYGERCWSWMFGDRSSLVYKLLFLTFTFLGSIITATQILEFGDLMILGMALPNILGVLLLSGKVRGQLDTYTHQLKNGEFKTYS